MSYSIFIRLLICMLVFLQSCCEEFKRPCNSSQSHNSLQLEKGFVCEDNSEINSTNWYLNLKIEDVEEEIQLGVKKIEYQDNIREDIVLANMHMKAGTATHAQLVDYQLYEDGYSAYRNAEIITEASRQIKDKYCQIYGTSAIQCAKDLTKVKLEGTSLGEMCLSEFYNKTACIGKNLMYRSPDGSCNNLKRSFLGKSTTAYKRLLFPVYLDGINKVSEDQPNPRILSVELVENEITIDPVKTMAMAYWTFFIGHDLSHTAMSSMRKSKKWVSCCDSSDMQLPFQDILHDSCMLIEIPYGDNFFRQILYNRYFGVVQKNCLNYVRSVPAVRSDCTFGPREQMNQATHYLDGSMIYGSSAQQAWSLRNKLGGQLLTSSNCHDKNQDKPLKSEYMPLNTDLNGCQYGSGTCYKAGDPRASGFPQLTVIYTLWMREHNRLAKQLSHINPHWDDERIFQEARKIVISSIQHITYAEWLPALLGKNYIRQSGLELLTKGYSNAYNDTIDPTVSNSFATAILPFGNSMITEVISLYTEAREVDEELLLSENYNQPHELMINKIDRLIRGLSTQNTQKIDMEFIETITNSLYSYHRVSKFGTDIVSMNIQRSRDHGIPSYTKFRKYCGLKDIENEQDLLEIMKPNTTIKLMKQYKNWNDIELLIGALFEKHEDDAMVGPTMRCIIREQFIRTRIADRYFYDLPEVFNEQQLTEIRKVTLARIFCDNSDNVTTMQKEVFLIPKTADLQPCNSKLIPKMNLNYWAESIHTILK